MDDRSKPPVPLVTQPVIAQPLVRTEQPIGEEKKHVEHRQEDAKAKNEKEKEKDLKDDKETKVSVPPLLIPSIASETFSKLAGWIMMQDTFHFARLLETLKEESRKDLLEQTNDHGHTLLHLCIIFTAPLRMVILLLKYKTKCTIADKYGFTPVHIAAQGDSCVAVYRNEYFRDSNPLYRLGIQARKFGISEASFFAQSAMAILHHQPEADVLVSKPVESKSFTPTNQSVFGLALFSGNTELVHGLLSILEMSSLLHIYNGYSCLHFIRDPNIVRSMWLQRPDVFETVLNQPDPNGFTALHFACQNGNVELAAILLQHPLIQINNTAAFNRETPFRLAKLAGSLDLVQLLLSYGAKI